MIYGTLQPGEGYRPPSDPAQNRLIELVSTGVIDVVDPDILVHTNSGTVEFRQGDQFQVVFGRAGTPYRVWPSESAYSRDINNNEG